MSEIVRTKADMFSEVDIIDLLKVSGNPTLNSAVGTSGVIRRKALLKYNLLDWALNQAVKKLQPSPGDFLPPGVLELSFVVRHSLEIEIDGEILHGNKNDSRTKRSI